MKSSEKILNFLVKDILDFAYLKQGKFRKNIQNFNILECIQEIVSIQQYKSEQLNIKLNIKAINFERNCKNYDANQIIYDLNNLIICTDQQRI